MTALPSSVELTVSLDGQPIADMLVTLTFTVTRKNRYDVVVGPSGIDGTILVGRDEILAWADQETSVAQMDFAGLKTNFAGTILATPVGVAEIQPMLEAHRVYETVMQFPPHYRDNVIRAGERLKPLAGRTLSVRGTLLPDAGDIVLSAASVIV